MIDGIVGEVLFWSLQKVLGQDCFTEEVLHAWVKVYNRLIRTIVPIAVELELHGCATMVMNKQPVLTSCSSCSSCSDKEDYPKKQHIAISGCPHKIQQPQLELQQLKNTEPSMLSFRLSQFSVHNYRSWFDTEEEEEELIDRLMQDTANHHNSQKKTSHLLSPSFVD